MNLSDKFHSIFRRPTRQDGTSAPSGETIAPAENDTDLAGETCSYDESGAPGTDDSVYMPQKNDVLDLTIEDQGMDGEGVAHVGGKVIFVRGALTGEKIRAKVVAVRPKFDIGILERVLVPSPERTQPPCPLFGKCGGCDLQHMNYDAQLRLKRKMVENALTKAGVIAQIDDTVPSERQFRYRNKVSLPVRTGRYGEIAIGLFSRNSHRVVQMNDCLLQYDYLPALIEALKAFMTERGLTGYDEETGTGDIRELVVREAGGVLGVAVVANRENVNIAPLFPRITEINPSARLWLNVNTVRNNVILGKSWRLVAETRRKSDIDGLSAEINLAGFLQINDGVRAKLYDYVCSLMPEGAVAIEAYSGAGLLSAQLCRRAAAVYGIELNRPAHLSALALKNDNGLDRFTPINGDVAEMLPLVLAKCETLCDKRDIFIVVDPPRTGLDEPARALLAGCGARNIVYIGCNPATLARDVATLTQAGYTAETVRPFDMFPQTANVETLVVLSHKKPDGHIGVKVEFGEEEGQISLKEVEKRAEERKPKEKVTYKMIQGYIEKTYGFKVHTAYIAEVKRDLGLPMYDAPNAVEELKRPRSHPSLQMVEAIRETLKHFEII